MNRKNGAPSIYQVWKETETSDLEYKYFEAIYQGNAEIVRECINEGIDPNITDDDEVTALHHAALHGDMPMGIVLLSSPKTEVNKVDSRKVTPLMYACTYRNAEFVKYLLLKHANPNMRNDKQETALHIACTQNSVKIAFELIRKGAQINVRDIFDNSPLSIAAIDRGSIPMTRFLLRKGANATKTKQFPLFLELTLNCSDFDRLEIIELLLKYGVDIYCLHPISKRNCLHYVAITGYLPAAKFLISQGEANLGVPDLAGRTPEVMAYEHHNWGVFNYYMKRIERKSVYAMIQDDIIQHISKLFDSETE